MKKKTSEEKPVEKKTKKVTKKQAETTKVVEKKSKKTKNVDVELTPVSAPVEVKTEKEKITRKTPLKIVNISKDVEVKETKYVTTLTKGDKRMWMRGSGVGMTHKITGIKGFKRLTEEEAKLKHLGKTRVLGKVSSQEELNELVEKYFN